MSHRKKKPKSPLWEMEGGLGEASFPSLYSRAPLYPHYHNLYGPTVLLPCHIALSVTDFQVDLAPLLHIY